jgi:hypothetical protein
MICARLLVNAAVVAILAVACGKDEATDRKLVDAMQSAAASAQGSAWHGTVHAKRFASGQAQTQNTVISVETMQVDLVSEVHWIVEGEARATVSYSESRQTDSKQDYSFETVTNITKSLTTASGTSSEARVAVSFDEDGFYTLEYSSGGVDGQLETESATQVICKPHGDPECKSHNDTTHQIDPIPRLGGLSGGVRDRLDKKNRRHLVGTYSEDYKYGDGTTGKTVVTWDLSR